MSLRLTEMPRGRRRVSDVLHVYRRVLAGGPELRRARWHDFGIVGCTSPCHSGPQVGVIGRTATGMPMPRSLKVALIPFDGRSPRIGTALDAEMTEPHQLPVPVGRFDFGQPGATRVPSSQSSDARV